MASDATDKRLTFRVSDELDEHYVKLFTMRMSSTSSVPSVGELVYLNLYPDYENSLERATERMKRLFCRKIVSVSFVDDCLRYSLGRADVDKHGTCPIHSVWPG